MDLHAKQLREEFWKNDALHGSPIGKPYQEIMYLSEHSEQECRKIRERKLYDMLDYTRKFSPYYHHITPPDDAQSNPLLYLASFPIMNKTKYLDEYDNIIIPEHLIPGQVGKVHIQSTSGSTGTPFRVPQDTRKRQRRVAELKYFGKIVGFETHEVLVHLRTWNRWQQKTPEQIKSENIIPFDISQMGEENLAELCDIISSKKAVCIRGYASSFDLLAKYVEKHPVNFPSLKICIAGSETLHDDVRACVKKNLHSEIISQYANEENGILAQERLPTHEKDNVMYLNHAGYYFELLKMESDEPVEYGELGRIVITDLHNHAFPIIRYDNGDVGVMAPPNEYSNGYPVLKSLYGRRFDVCYTTSNQPFSPMTIGRVMKHYDEIAQWQFIQKGQKEYVIKIVMKTGKVVSDYLQPALSLLRETLGEDAVISVLQTDDITVLASGKRKPVVNEWKQNNCNKNK